MNKIIFQRGNFVQESFGRKKVELAKVDIIVTTRIVVTIHVSVNVTNELSKTVDTTTNFYTTVIDDPSKKTIDTTIRGSAKDKAIFNTETIIHPP